MGYRVTRKTYRIGNATGVTLPKPWLDYHGEKKVDKLTLIGNAILVVAPKGYEEQAQRIVEGLEKGERNSRPPAVIPTPKPEEEEVLETFGVDYTEIVPLEERIGVLTSEDLVTAFMDSYDSFYKRVGNLFPGYKVSRVDTITIDIGGEKRYQPGRVTMRRIRGIVAPTEEENTALPERGK